MCQTVIDENVPSVWDEVSEEWKDKLGVKVVPPLFLSNFCFFTSTKLSCLFPTKMMDEAFHRCCYCWCWKIIFTKITIFRWECQRLKLIVIVLSTINNYSMLIYILMHSILVSCKKNLILYWYFNLVKKPRRDYWRSIITLLNFHRFTSHILIWLKSEL